MATIKQIAEMTNVSRGTIDRVINNRGGVNPETEKKVRAAMEALHYLPNKAGQNLAIRKKKLKFGFILFSANPYNPFFSDVEAGIRAKAQELEEFGVTVDIRFTSINKTEEQLAFLDEFSQKGYNGIAIAALNIPAVADKIREISIRGIPVVTVNTDIPNSGRLAYVGSDYFKCGEVAANLMGLISAGKAKIAIISGSENIMCITERISGFQKFLFEHYPEAKIVCTITNDHYDEIESYLITKKVLEDHPEITAIYLSSGGVHAACRAVAEAKRKITVISNDCTAATRQLLREGIIAASIDQNPGYQGSKPLELLFEAAVNGTHSMKEHYFTNAIIKISSNLTADDN